MLHFSSMLACCVVCYSGVDHVIVPVEGSRRGSRQQFLRDLRYNALLEHCRSTGSKTLLLGHHMEDQLGGWCTVGAH